MQTSINNQTSGQTVYRGRFAPTPSGPLHFGSLFTAVASYLDAKSNNGKWLLRIDDLDPPREQAGASKNIIQTLEHHGLKWDEEIIFQSAQNIFYAQQLNTLLDKKLIFPCSCSRLELKDFKTYPKICNAKTKKDFDKNQALAWRLITEENSLINFQDGLQEQQNFKLASLGGDFILQRKDGLYAYHLAVVVDDAMQNITHVVRGIDLLDNTPQHIFLQKSLRLETPHYLHLPVLTNTDGTKLSKQYSSTPLDNSQASSNLRYVLKLLKQKTPPNNLSNCQEILDWATTHWDLKSLKNLKSIVIE